MFPACRTAGDEFARPTFALTPRDVAGFTDELQEFQGLFHDCLPRREPRAHCCDSMVGQWRPLARTSIEPMALRVPGGSVRGLQRFLREVPWDAEHMRWTSHQLVAEARGEPDGVVRFDETGLVKKGTDSVGVARQSCSPRGTVEHGPGGVCGLCLPERLCARGQAGVPAGTVVDGRVGGPPDHVSRAHRTHVSEQTAAGGGHVRGSGA